MTDRNDVIASLEGVTKKYGTFTALDNLNLDIEEGQFVTLLGPSGCGKSTTLRILGGFEQPTKGRIMLEGEDVTRRPPNKRNVNMVFQDYALFPHLTVARNIAFGLELKGQSRSKIDKRIDELLNFLELTPNKVRYPDELSGGQRQRVALARALGPDPALLLLDEPLGALDAKLRGQVQEELKDIQKRSGKTFVFVTHDQDEALVMSDRVVVMNNGRVEQDGPPEELYLKPKNRFVSEFIGETNLLSCTVRSVDEGTVTIEWMGSQIRQKNPDNAARAGDSVNVAIRPENFHIHQDRPATGNAVQAVVTDRTFRGSSTAFKVSVGADRSVRLKAIMDGNPRFGDDVWLSWESSSMAMLHD